MKDCSICKKERLSEGGVDLGAGRWSCMHCWIKRMQRRSTK